MLGGTFGYLKPHLSLSVDPLESRQKVGKVDQRAITEQLVKKTLMPNLVKRLRDIQSNGSTLTLAVKNSTNVLSEVEEEITC